MKILNLYAGIGGNREYWNGHFVTAVEIDPLIADVYQKLYPSDDVIVGDAHMFLESNFKNYDFIWSSPPCPSHGQYRHNVGVLAKGYNPILPDMRLYSEIIFLMNYCDVPWVVENTKPYYEPLIRPSFCLQRHLFWSNYSIPETEFPKSEIRTKNKISDFENGIFIADSAIKNKRQVLRNCITPALGKYVLDEILKAKEKPRLFDLGQ